MTLGFQEMLFSDFGYDRKKLVDFNLKPEDRQLSNATLYDYEYAVFKDDDGKFVKASSYMLPVADTTSVRLFVKTASDTDEEMKIFKREISEEEEGIETYVVGKHVMDANEFFESLKEDIEDASEEENSDKK